MPRRFHKAASSDDDLIKACVRRGLEIGNHGIAITAFLNIGYFRLSGYMTPFIEESGGHQRFEEGTTLDRIIDLYEFDSKLRSMVMRELEKIEIFSRSAISNTLSTNKGPHWFMDPSNFRPEYDHAVLMDRLGWESDRGRGHENHHAFIREYYEKFDEPPYPPSWMVFEILSFGTLSRIFHGLATEHRKNIARRFGINRSMLASWLHTLSVLRNICAHHSRLWNRAFGVKPQPEEQNLKMHFIQRELFYSQAVVIKVLLDQTVGSSSWVGGLKKLLSDHPNVPMGKMGFNPGWDKTDIWLEAYGSLSSDKEHPGG